MLFCVCLDFHQSSKYFWVDVRSYVVPRSPAALWLLAFSLSLIFPSLLLVWLIEISGDDFLTHFCSVLFSGEPYDCILVILFCEYRHFLKEVLAFSSSARKQPGCSELWDGKMWWAVTLLPYGREVTSLCLLYWPWHRSTVAYGTWGIW